MNAYVNGIMHAVRDFLKSAQAAEIVEHSPEILRDLQQLTPLLDDMIPLIRNIKKRREALTGKNLTQPQKSIS
jgi:hypothetical protein